MHTLLRLYSLMQMVRPIKAATDSNGNGYLTSALSLQFSTDGTTWYDSAKHQYRCLIRMQHSLLQDFLMEGINPWLQLCAAHADPGTQCRSRCCQTRARKDQLVTISGAQSPELTTL
jgi:hypothetical protein